MSLLLPDFLFESVTEVVPSFLKCWELRLVLLDFDNTMLPYTTNEPDAALLAWIDRLKRAKIRLCIVSNSRKPRVTEFARKYNIPCVTNAGKPGARGIREAMKRFGVQPIETALIGDQIYTDVLGAKRAGITAIHVRSIHNHTFWLRARHLLEVPLLAVARRRRPTKW